jgi:rare lipoprotein A (peptidoglycan hydrolase)
VNAVAAISLSVIVAYGSGAGRAAAVPLPPQAACMAPALVAGPPVPPSDSPTVLVGVGTWYDATMGGRQSTWYTRAGIQLYGAAGPALRAVKQHYWRTSWLVLITSTLTGKSVVVQVVDECSCIGVRRDPNDGRLIDLAPAVWHRLGVKLGRGVMPISLQVLP